MELELRNAHVRDSRIRMQVDIHTYFIDGEAYSGSVSSLLHDYFDQFDAPGTISRYFDSWKQGGKYAELIKYLSCVRAMDDIAIKKEIEAYWSAKGSQASSRGTFVHEEIEKSLNNLPYDTSYEEISQYAEWKRTWADANGWVPFRTEWSVFDEDARIAGQIDSIWMDRDSNLHMVDWKCCDPTPRMAGDPPDLLGPNMRCFGNRRGIGHCAKVPDTKYGHYMLQQNAYKYMLEKNYGVHVASMYLLQMHPNMETYHFVEIKDIQPVVSEIFGDRVAMIACVSPELPQDAAVKAGSPTQCKRAREDGTVEPTE